MFSTYRRPTRPCSTLQRCRYPICKSQWQR